MKLESRYIVAICVGIMALSVGMILISRAVDVLVLAFMFNIPFAPFGKWLFVRHETYVAAKGINLGLPEMLLVCAYIVWFSQIFIAKIESIPRLKAIDYMLLLLILVQMLSLIGAPDKTLGAFDIIYNAKHALIYFFIAHKVKRKHLQWFVLFILIAIMMESSLGLYERLTGNVGIGLSKGGAESLGEQRIVPGIENEIRATGTTTDSHTLGLYYAMILPIPFVLLMMNFLKSSTRVVMAGVLVFGAIGLLVTFSRAAWLSFAIAMIIAIIIILFSWKQGKSIFVALCIIATVTLLYPKTFEMVYDRLTEAPSEVLSSRYDMNWVALDIWTDNFLFGYGAGNYARALDDPDTTIVGDRDDLPVHNAYLYTAAEVGIVGLIAFYSVILLAISRCYKMLKCEDLLLRGLALAILTGFLGYLLDGLTDPMFKAPVPFMHLFICMGLSSSFERLSKEQIN